MALITMNVEGTKMIIKNITTFLVTATLLGAIFPLHATSIENDTRPTDKTSSFFQRVTLDESKMKSLRARTVSGSDVSIIPVDAVPEELLDGLRGNYGHNFSLTGTYKGKDSCVVVADTSGDEKIVPLYVDNSLYGLVDRHVQNYYTAAHELSHCLNSNTQKSLDLLNALIIDPRFKQYAKPINALESSSREAHADLIASLLGASKTGDWTIFNQAILPIRTSYFDPTHSTVIAVGKIIDSLDPTTLKGQSFEVITSLGNELFRRNFMDTQGRLDPAAPGMTDILKDWQAASLESVMYMTHEGAENTPDENRVLANIVQYQEAAALIASEGALHNLQDLTFAYALKAVNLESQNTIARTLMTRKSDVITDFIDSNENKVVNLDFIAKISSHEYHGESKTFSQSVKDIKGWQRHFSHEHAINELAHALASLGREALIQPGDHQAIVSIEKAESAAKNAVPVSKSRMHAYVVSNLTGSDKPMPAKHVAHASTLNPSLSEKVR
jgi:hypothetical protein